MNGDIATNEQLIWGDEQPNNYGNDQDCLAIRVPAPYYRRGYDIGCSDAFIGLCEKMI